MIGFVGSVFSPYYAHARRHGRGDPENHVALNVALYGVRGPGWAMTERGRGALWRNADTLRIGPSRMEWDGAALHVSINEWTFPVPRPLRGRISLYPAALHDDATDLDAAGRHRWTPIAPCARVDVAFDRPGWRWSGSGYFDSNDGDAPLERDFLRWDWSRAHHADRGATIFYDATRRDGTALSLARRFTPDGAVAEVLMPPRHAMRRRRWGMRPIAHADAPPVVDRMCEDAPFYTRAILRTQVDGAAMPAMHESLSVARFDQRWVQGLLPFRMPRRARWPTERGAEDA